MVSQARAAADGTGLEVGTGDRPDPTLGWPNQPPVVATSEPTATTTTAASEGKPAFQLGCSDRQREGIAFATEHIAQA
jgi:hypothetical protein